MAKFSRVLSDWYRENHRSLPWRDTRDPYKIWVSEVILQQTRVDQGLSYYLRFIDRFPGIASLASATEEEVLKVWQGLGYYSRARNMHQAARKLQEHFQGSFPSSFEEILSLEGIGDYTASAVASFAFNLPYPVMDGNVIRFISRLKGISEPVTSSKGKRLIRQVLEKEIDRKEPGLFNQAMMEFGALACTPRDPSCSVCPFRNDCVAYQTRAVSRYPMKEKKKAAQSRHFNYLIFILKEKGQVFTFLNKRSGDDIWKNLYEFPLVESDRLLEWDELGSTPEWEEKYAVSGHTLLQVSGEIQHILSHRRIKARYFMIRCGSPPEGLLKVRQNELVDYPMPRLVEKLIDHSNITFFDLMD